MSLLAGQILTHYESAKDTRYEREVTIKVLPEELAHDEERLRRFEREAKTLATLNHPTIAGIHKMDQVEDTCFTAMELVSNEDLPQRIERGALPVEEALEPCRQMATGFEAAHDAGVVHRDLKPTNIRITTSDVVKLIDFGLAKPIFLGMSKSGSKAGISTAQSDSFAMTAEARLLGTPTHMSPEQARGKPIDRRTDIWAFGCALFECPTAKRAFGGDNFSDLTASILKGAPDWSALEGKVSAPVSPRLGVSLEFDPPQQLLSFETVDTNTETQNSDMSADGQRILALTAPDASRPRQIEIVPHWTKELESLFKE